MAEVVYKSTVRHKKIRVDQILQLSKLERGINCLEVHINWTFSR